MFSRTFKLNPCAVLHNPLIFLQRSYLCWTLVYMYPYTYFRQCLSQDFDFFQKRSYLNFLGSYLQKRGVIHQRRNCTMRRVNRFEAITCTEYTKQNIVPSQGRSRRSGWSGHGRTHNRAGNFNLFNLFFFYLFFPRPDQ